MYAELDNLAETGRFFVALAQRLDDDPGVMRRLRVRKGAETALTELSHALWLPVPPELRDATIEILDDDHEISKAPGRTTVVIDYPPVLIPEQGPQQRAAFKKCATVCGTVSGVKVCATICVSVSVGLSGIHGSVSATLTASF